MRYSPQPKPISDGQKRMIYALANKAGMDDELLHAMVKGMTMCEHISRLTCLQGIQIIERLQKDLGEEPKAAPENRATNAQQLLIYGLSRDMGWGGDSKRLRAFLEKRFGASDVRYLTAQKTAAVIEAMKAMRDGDRGERRRDDG